LLIVLPIRTDSPVRRLPYVNYVIIALNVLTFVATDVLDGLSLDGQMPDKRHLALDPGSLEVYQFFSYQFLHGDLTHLLGNMLFLWVFGNSVNCRMGNVAYALFYLACGVFAGAGFAITAQNPCLGASGAIAGITTAYLVMFPQAQVTVFYWLWLYIGTMHVQALWLIFGKIILWDNILSPRLGGGGSVQVAYTAHIAGYVFGFAGCWIMLVARAVPRDQFDLAALARLAYRRRKFRDAMADPDAAARAAYGRVAPPIAAEEPEFAANDETTRARAEIAELLSAGNYAEAAERYQALMARDPEQCLSRRQLLDVANQLFSMNRYPQAAAAYEKFLKAYPGDVENNQIKLILGIIYAKYLQQYEAAEGYLRECLIRLSNPDQLAQASHWLEEAHNALGRRSTPA